MGKLIYLHSKRNYHFDECQHVQMEVDIKLNNITCKDCGKELNPIWVLNNMAIDESNYEHKRQAYIKAKEELDKRVRTKCQHCKKMTRIKGV